MIGDQLARSEKNDPLIFVRFFDLDRERVRGTTFGVYYSTQNFDSLLKIKPAWEIRGILGLHAFDIRKRPDNKTIDTLTVWNLYTNCKGPLRDEKCWNVTFDWSKLRPHTHFELFITTSGETFNQALGRKRRANKVFVLYAEIKTFEKSIWAKKYGSSHAKKQAVEIELNAQNSFMLREKDKKNSNFGRAIN